MMEMEMETMKMKKKKKEKKDEEEEGKAIWRVAKSGEVTCEIKEGDKSRDANPTENLFRSRRWLSLWTGLSFYRQCANFLNK
uniref:Uncharacterized protein n=2 Tax=Caenorhabditis japonica TaxID=281687 RepID=A0A8R1IN62_CAEJA